MRDGRHAERHRSLSDNAHARLICVGAHDIHHVMTILAHVERGWSRRSTPYPSPTRAFFCQPSEPTGGCDGTARCRLQDKAPAVTRFMYSPRRGLPEKETTGGRQHAELFRLACAFVCVKKSPSAYRVTTTHLFVLIILPPAVLEADENAVAMIFEQSGRQLPERRSTRDTAVGIPRAWP